VLLYSPSSFWLFLRKKGFLKKCWWGHLNSLDCFFGGGIFEEIFFYFNVGNFPMFGFFSLVHFLRGQQFSQHR
jgi:hypothetical protein